MSKETILIVEDEAITGMGIKKILTDFGYSVIGIVPTGEQAVEIAIEEKPDLILMDIQLAGEMDGTVAAENIRVRTHIPVIYLTAFSDDQFIQKAKITEPFGYILKPVREQELKTTIEMALYKHSMDLKLRVSEETARVLLNETVDMHFLMDTDGKLLAVNESLANKAGRTVDQLAYSPVIDLVSLKILSPNMVSWRLAPDQRNGIQFEEEFSGRWFDVGVHPVYNPLGEVVKYAVHIHDITRKKEIEEELRHNEKFFHTLIGDASDIVVVLNADGTFRRQSPTLNQIIGWTREQIEEKKLFDVLQKDDVERAQHLFDLVLQNPYVVKPFRFVFKDPNENLVAVEGIISNLYDKSNIYGVVLCGWIVFH